MSITEIVLTFCAILQTIILGLGVYTTWAIAYNKVLPFHQLKWQSEFIKKRKQQEIK